MHAFKFYSSSYVLRTAAGTVAVDFCQGPINNGGEPEQRDEYRSGFCLRPDQRDRLVPRLLAEAAHQPTVAALAADRYAVRFTLAFDREGYSPELL